VPLTDYTLGTEQLLVNATNNNYGFNLSTVDYVQLKGFTVDGADLDNIYAQGNNVTISNNKTLASVGGSGIKIETGTPFTITNNLSYSNFKYGIEDLSANNTIKNNTCDDNGGTNTPATGVTLFDYDVESGDYSGWVTGAGDWGVYDNGTYSNSPTHMFGITNGNDYIQYETVDVTGYNNLTISCYARSYASNMNNSDDLYFYYSFDGSTWTQFDHIQNDHNTYAQYSATGVSPTSNDLYIKFSGICNSSEYWFVDDILVTGDETGSPFQSGAGLYVANVAATVENNIFVAKSGNNAYYALISPGNSVSSDYNTYFKNGNSFAFDYNGSQDDTGPNGASDILTDPVFVIGADYHIQSTADSYHGGEWPPTTATAGTWTTDATTSTAVDAGNADAFANEPAPNGSVINQGAYGNTLQASKSSTVVCTYPSTQTSNFAATPDVNSIDISWTRGNGNAVLVVARQGSAVNQDPIDGVNYTANAAFGSGSQIGTGNWVVYNGTLTSETVTALTASTTYYFAFYEYNSTGYCYLVPEYTGNSTTTSPATYNWTGATNSNWFTTTNWSSSLVPSSSDDVTIPNGQPNYPVINNGLGNIAVCNNLTINSNASLTIDADGYMTVSGSITNNGDETNLIINSDDTGTGSLIQNTSGGVDATVNCRLSSTGRQWHMVIYIIMMNLLPITGQV